MLPVVPLVITGEDPPPSIFSRATESVLLYTLSAKTVWLRYSVVIRRETFNPRPLLTEVKTTV